MTEATLSTGLPLAKLRPIAPSSTTASASPNASSRPSRQLSRLADLPRSNRRTLDFDLECVITSFDDPSWAQVTVCAWAYSWVGSGDVHVETLPVAAFYDDDARRRFLLPLLAVIEEAGVVTGHNIIKADLPWLNGECMKLDLPTLPTLLVQDTMRLPRGRVKKGQDNLAVMFGLREEKLPLNWFQWQRAYAEPGHKTLKERAAGDVVQNIALREAMRQRGLLRAPRLWNP